MNKVDALEFVEIGSNFIKELDLGVEMDEELFKIFSMCSSGCLSPMFSVIGSISAQEIIKVDKFNPMFQNINSNRAQKYILFVGLITIIAIIIQSIKT